MRCPICHSTPVDRIFEMNTFDLMLCPICHLIFQDISILPVQNGWIDRIYNEDWVKMKEAKAVEDLYNHFIFYSHVVSLHCPKGGSLLELGCGTGEFLFLMRQTGRMVKGIEPSSVSSANAKEKYDLDIIHSEWNDRLLGPDEKYDAIVFWHVLEHIPEPVKFFSELKTALKDNGCMIFCVPNMECYTNMLLREHSPVFTEQDHLFHYSALNLSMLLCRTGLRSVEMFSWEPPFRLENEWNIYTAVTPHTDESEIRQQFSFFAQLQAEERGYELFCVAEKL